MQKASNHILYIYKYIHRYFCQICKSSKPMRIGALHCRKRDVIREVCIKDKLMQRPMNTTHTRPLNKLCIRGQLKFLTHLNLRQNLLSGEIPRELGNLKVLESLYLCQNNLTGPIFTEVGNLRQLRQLALYQNRLSSEIPQEISQLRLLESLSLSQNQLSGQIPPQLGQLVELKYLNLHSNQLWGKIPRDLGSLQKLTLLQLAQNQLTGQIPFELGLATNLRILHLEKNQLHGQIPQSIFNHAGLQQLHLHHNQLWGQIGLGELPSLTVLHLSYNRLTGEIPRSIGHLKSLQSLHLESNHLSGPIPEELWTQKLQDVHLNGNAFKGPLPPFQHMLNLQLLDLGNNFFEGEVPPLPRSLELLDLSHNDFAGSVASVVEPFCNLQSIGGQLRELRLNHNRFIGRLPPCLMQFRRLKHLSLNNNGLSGLIPEVEATELVVLTLHRNSFSGPIPRSFQNLEHLSVLTLHENSFRGPIIPLRLTSPCIDNPRFELHSTTCYILCVFLEAEQTDCRALMELLHYPILEVELVRLNCPDLCGTCDSEGSSNATFHHNRFSCHVPDTISSNNTAIHATGVMGNMLGQGLRLNASWISAEENQAFLYYSPKVWNDNLFVMVPMVLLVLTFALLHRPLQHQLRKASRSLSSGAASRVAASNLTLIKVAGLSILMSWPLLMIFWAGTGYHTCSPPLSQITLANLQENVWGELGVVVAWCGAVLFFRSILLSMPKTAESPLRYSRARGPSMKTQVLKGLAWLLWFSFVSVLSMPSILVAAVQALPKTVNQEWFSHIHSAAPFLIVAIDTVVASALSMQYSARSGIKADRLLMTFRLFSAWLLSLLTTVFLHENCLGGWKLFWIVCREEAPEHQSFNWKIWDEEILNTKKDMCSLNLLWWQDGRCSRSIVEGLTALLLKKLLIRSTLQPLVMLVLWSVSRPEPTEHPEEGRHLQLLKGPKTTGSLLPLQQMALLTTYIETLFFWCPLIPLLSIGILSAAVANLFLFDVAIWRFHVRLPSDTRSRDAGISRSYLSFSLGASCCFQVWHAFCTEMSGRYLLLVANVVLLGPWARRLLPLDRAKNFFWADLIRAGEAEVIELAIRIDVEGRDEDSNVAGLDLL
ncbi:unnamed protein product [Durusdinium trenchii]|uniref:Uncharacterized protein n=1 Tax=Durusdinium trenchii TaxID=1381693 RepID=A0ABP0JKR0_9DINO